MKHAAPVIALCAAFGAISLGLQGRAQAQAGQGPVKVDVGKIEVTLQKTPRLSTESGTKEKRDEQKTWLEIEVGFTADMRGSDDYINELEFSYFLYFESNPKAKSVYTANITHINVPKDEMSYSVAYVSPTTLGKLLGKDKMVKESDVWVAVEVKSQGTLVGGDANQSKSKRWWQSATVGRVEGMLLNKAQTPFAFLWWDRYPEVKPSR